jgi:hypothetical protein
MSFQSENVSLVQPISEHTNGGCAGWWESHFAELKDRFEEERFAISKLPAL